MSRSSSKKTMYVDLSGGHASPVCLNIGCENRARQKGDQCEKHWNMHQSAQKKQRQRRANELRLLRKKAAAYEKLVRESKNQTESKSK